MANPEKQQRRQRGSALPFQRADGRWVVPVILGNGKHQQFTKGIRTEKDAYALWGTLQAEQKQRKHRAPRKTVAALLVEWERHARARRPWSESTAITYRNHVQRRILPAFGTLLVDACTTQDVQQWLTGLAEATPRQSARTIRQARAILLAAFDLAEDWGWTERNPVRRSRPPAAPRGQSERPSLADAQAILAAFPGPPMRGIVGVALHTGMRLSEIVGLRWEDVTEETIHVRGQLAIDGLRYTPRTKTGSVRMLPIFDPLSTLLAEQRMITDDEGYVFRRADGRPLSRQYAWGLWTAGLKTVGLPHRKFHATRHMATTLLRALGVDIAVRRAIVGHERDDTNLGYTHVDATDLRPALEALAGALRNG